MIAFFDTNIYVDLLRNRIKIENLSPYMNYVIRLSPIVKSELFRGCKTDRARKLVFHFIQKLVELPAPTNQMWDEAAIIMAKLSSHSNTTDDIQNDVLLSLTARHTGTIIITQDKDFEKIQKFIEFKLILVKPETYTK